MLKDNRLKKKDGNKQVWQEMVRTEEYQQGRRERYKIERKFGEAKLRHGLGRCRYIWIGEVWGSGIPDSDRPQFEADGETD